MSRIKEILRRGGAKLRRSKPVKAVLGPKIIGYYNGYCHGGCEYHIGAYVHEGPKVTCGNCGYEFTPEKWTDEY